MDACELRIGNIVRRRFLNSVEEDCVITGFDFWHFEKKNYSIEHEMEWEALSPIPLTEEWLIKFGSEKEPYSIFLLNGLFITEIGGKFYHLLSARIIETVHQLQNLYFALKGEELEIN